MARQTTDNLYIELGYFTPEEYYTYEAIASAANAVVASLSADVGVIRQGDSSQSVVASITATISNIKGVDIVLAPFASVTADAVVTRDAVSSQSSSAAQTTSSDRLRDFAISLSGAFAFAVIADGGNVQNASASISSAITQTAVGNLVADMVSTQSSEFSQTAAATVTRDLSSSQTVTASQSTLGGVIYEQASTITDAFSVTMAVNVTVNPFATLETAAIMTTDFVVNRSANITLDTIGNLNAQAIRSAGLTSTISAVASQTTQGNSQSQAQSSLQSSASLTANVQKIKTATGNFSAVASMSATGVRNSRTARNWTIHSDGEYKTAVKKFGTASVGLKNTATLDQTYGIATNSQTGFDYGINNWTIDFWNYESAGWSTSSQYREFLNIYNGGINIAIGRLWTGTNSNFRLSYYNSSTGLRPQVTATGISTPLTQWHHYRLTGQVTATNTLVVTLWVNGSRVVQQTATNFTQSNSGTHQIIGHGPFNTRWQAFDEFRFYQGNLTDKDTLSFTPPTAAFVNDYSTISLAHFDSSNLDDVEITLRLGSASVSSTATFTANGIRVKNISSALTCAATVSATAVRTRPASANLAANGFVVTVAGYRIDDLADLNSVATMAVTATKTASAVSTQASTASVTAVGGYQKQFASEPFVQFHVDADINAVRGFDIALNSAFAQSADAQRLRGITAQLAAEGFTLIVAGTQQTATADLSSAFTISAQANRTRDFNSSVSSSASMSVAVGEIVQYSATLASAVTQTSSGDRIRLGVTSITAQATVSASVIKTADSNSSVNTSASVTASAVRTRDVNTSLLEFLTLTAQGNYVVSNTSTTSAQAQQTTQGNYIAKGSMNGSAVGFVIAVTAYTSTTNSDMHSTATMSVTANYIISQSSTQSSAFSLSAVNARVKQFGTVETVFGVTPNTSNQSQYGPFLKLTQSEATTSVGCFYVSAYMKDAVGTVFDSYPDKPNEYIVPTGEPSGSRLIIETSANIPSFYYYGENGYVSWQLSSEDIRQSLVGFHHYFLRVNIAESTNQLKYRLFLDGVEIPQTTVSGTDILFRVAGSYNLMMDTGYTTTTNHWTARADISGFGDIGSGWGPAAIGQFIFDYRTSYTSSTFPVTIVDKLYPYADLGLNGTATGLTQPIQYIALEDYTDISNRGTLAGNYQWKQLTLAQSPYRYTLGNFTATTANNITGYTNNILAVSSLSASAQSVQVISAVLNSSVTVTAQTEKTAVFQTSISSNASLSAVTKVNKTFLMSLQAQSTVSAQTSKTAINSANFSVNTALSIQGDIVTGAVVNLSSAVTVLAISGTRADAQSSQTAVSTMSVSADRVKDVFISVGSNCSTSASAVKTARAQFNQTSVAALNCTADKIRATQIDILSDSGLSAQPRKTARITSTQSAVFTQISNVGQIKGTSANLSALYATLTVGRVIHLDPYRTYVIDPETRIFKITEETRVYTINAETRVNIIQGYNQ